MLFLSSADSFFKTDFFEKIFQEDYQIVNVKQSGSKQLAKQGCGNTMPDLFDLVPFHSGKVENFNLIVLGQVQNLYKVNKILYFIF